MGCPHGNHIKHRKPLDAIKARVIECDGRAFNSPPGLSFSLSSCGLIYMATANPQVDIGPNCNTLPHPFIAKFIDFQLS